MIYNLIFASAAAVNFGSILQKSARDVLYYALLLVFFLFVAFRWNVGCDWGSYMHHAKIYGDLPLDEAAERSEPLYWLTVTILPKFGMEWPAINFFSTLTFFLGLHAFAKRQPDKLLFITLSFPALITGIPMSALRQSFAMGFVMLAFTAFIDFRRLRYVVLVVVAGLFHASAFAFLVLVPFISRTELRRKFILAGLFAIPGIFFLSRTSSVETYQALYVDSIHDAAGGPARIALLSITALVFLVSFRDKWRIMYPQDYQLVTLTSFIMLALFPIVFLSSVIGDRFRVLHGANGLRHAKPLCLDDEASLFFLFLRSALLVGGASLFIWSNYSSIFQSCYLPYEHWFMDDKANL